MVIYGNHDESESLVDLIHGLIKSGSKKRTLIMSSCWRESKELYKALAKKYPDVKLESGTPEYYKLANGDVWFYVLGDGSKIRSMRADNLIVNGYYTVPKDVLAIVVAGFLATSSNPIEQVKQRKGK